MDTSKYVSWKCSANKKKICTEILNRWENLKEMILEGCNDNETIKFMYFDKVEVTTKKGDIIKRLKPIPVDANISYIVSFIDKYICKFIHHRNQLKSF